MKILLVDDDSVFRALISIAIEKDDREIVQANSGSEALEILQDSSATFDAIITDLQMPGMTGIDLLEAMKTLGVSAPCVLHSSDEYGTIPGIGYAHLSTISSAFPNVEFHSKMERHYLQRFLDTVAQAQSN